MDIITAQNLSAGYGRTEVLRDLTFNVPEARITAIVGTSGCGKSTLLKTLAGLIPPLAGKVFFGGSPVDYRSASSLASLYKGIGVLYQGGALLNNMTLFENVALPIRMQHSNIPVPVLQEMVYARLAQVDLVQSASKYPAELSGGMRKRVALARALVNDPRVVLCDEPSAGLDPITSGHLDDLLLNLKEMFHTTLVIVTHELRSIEKVADRVIVLKDGRMPFAGEYRDLLVSDDDFLRTFFLRKARP